MLIIWLVPLRLLAADPVDLAGQWRFAMDRSDVGVNERWFSRNLSDTIKLPGILQSQGYGDEISLDTPWVAALPRDMSFLDATVLPTGMPFLARAKPPVMGGVAPAIHASFDPPETLDALAKPAQDGGRYTPRPSVISATR